MKMVLKILLGVWLSIQLSGIASAQTVEYIHTDALGTPVAVTDASGNVIERSEYAPYGELLNRPAQDGPGFTGHVQDAATGFSYMQQRYYDPLGRFLSVDPVTAHDNPVTNFCRYCYANNNPYKFTDPDGRQTLPPSTYRIDWSNPETREAFVYSASIAADFTPGVSDVKGFYDAYNDPSAASIAAAGVGLVPVIGDGAAKLIKGADKVADVAKAAEKAVDQGPRLARGNLREQVLNKGRQADGSVTCTYCGKPTATTSDHVVPYSKGGPTKIDNLEPACASCNSSKGNKDLGTQWVPPKDRDLP